MSLELHGTNGIDFNDGSNQSTSATPYGRKNLIINGDMRIAQRGTSETGITSLGYYTVDRMKFICNSIGTWTQTQDTDVPTGQGFYNSFKLQCTTADASPASTDALQIQTRLEGQNLQHLKKGTSSAEKVTLSFWVKSNKTGTYIVEARDMDNTRHFPKSYTIDTADTWEKKTITFDGDTTGTLDNDNNASFDLQWWLGAGATYASGTLPTSWSSTVNANRAAGQTVNLADSTSNYINITGVQLEVGDAASDFEFMPYDMELQRCQRYYYKWSNETTYSGITSGIMGYSTSDAYGIFRYPQIMRASPNISNSALSTFRIFGNGGLLTEATKLVWQQPTTILATINTAASGMSGTGNYVLSAYNQAVGDCYIEFNAEL